MNQARERFMGTLEKMIRERRRGLEAYPEDFLQHLLLEDKHISCGDESQSLSDEQIKDNILTMIIAGQRPLLLIMKRNETVIMKMNEIMDAGQDTTASAISWMVKYLDENQEVLQILKVSRIRIGFLCFCFYLWNWV